jgi:hypothetical protein
MLERVQQRVTKMVVVLKNLSYEQTGTVAPDNAGYETKERRSH